MERFARRCDATGRGINEGYVVGDGDLYFSEEKYLIEHLRSRGWMDGLDEFILKEAYLSDEYYYTEWDEVDEDDWYDEDGNEYSTS